MLPTKHLERDVFFVGLVLGKKKYLTERQATMKRPLYLTLGFLSLGIGLIGIFLPVMPTVPFILLASYLFYHSSEKAYRWLLRHPLFGSHLQSYHRYRAVSKRTKIFAIIVLWFSLIVSMLVFRRPITYYILPLVGLIGTIVIIQIPTMSDRQTREWSSIKHKPPA